MLIVVLEKPVPIAHERVVGLMPKIRVPACSGEKRKTSSSFGGGSQSLNADQSPRETPCHTAWGQACENRPEDGEEPERSDEAGARGV